MALPSTTAPSPARSRVAARVAIALVFLLPLAMLAVGWGMRPVAPPFIPRPGRLPEAHWAGLAALSTPRDDFGVAPAAGRVYVLGGAGGTSAGLLDSSEIFDPATGRWGPGPALPTPRARFGAATLEGSIYAVGGATNERPAVALVEALDGASGRWRSLAPLPAPRADLAVVELGGRIYAIGGQADGGTVGTVDAYDPATDRWTGVAPLPTPRHDLAAVALAGRIYALGGRVDGVPSGIVEVYDPATGGWTSGPEIGVPMADFGAAVLDGRIHALSSAGHRVYDCAVNRWITGVPMPTARGGQGIVGLGDSLYAVGGRAEGAPAATGVAEVLLPGPAPDPPASAGERSTGGSLAVVAGGAVTVLSIVLMLAFGRRVRRVPDAPRPEAEVGVGEV